MSKGADNLKIQVIQYMKKYRNIKVTFENKAIFNLRWDIVINTKIPIVFEFQGQQHYKFTAFFHKNVEGSLKAKEYDNLKKTLHNNGKVKLIEVTKEDLTFSELYDILEPYEKIFLEENNECKGFKKGSRILAKPYDRKSENVQREQRSENYFSFGNGSGHK